MMETRQFKNRFEQVDYYAKLRGWEPMTAEEKKGFDEAIRTITHLD